MIFQVQIGQAKTFEWCPAYLPDPTGAPSVTFYANNTSATKTLEASASQSVSGVPDAYRLSLGALSSAAFAGLVGSTGAGGWYLHLAGFGQFAVNVSHFDDAQNELILAEALPVGVPSDATGTIYHNKWRCTLSADELTAAVDRAGYYQINYQVDDDPGATNVKVRLMSERGRLRVVRAAFLTGLTASDLTTLVPQLEATRPASREGWQPYINDYDIIGDVEAKLPANRYADQTLGEQFRRAHALLVASSLAEIGYAPNVDPERMRAAADAELSRQIQRLHWIDSDDDGLIDSDETGTNPESLVSITRSSNTDTADDYTNGRRYRPRLDDSDDR